MLEYACVGILCCRYSYMGLVTRRDGRKFITVELYCRLCFSGTVLKLCVFAFFLHGIINTQGWR